MRGMRELVKGKAGDKHGEMYIRACVLVMIVSMVFSVLLFFLCAVAQVKAQRKSAYQTLDEYTQNNAITISGNIKMMNDQTDSLNPDAFIEQLCSVQNLDATEDGLAAVSASGYTRFIVSDVSLAFSVEETTNIYATYTLSIPMNFLGQLIWFDVPLTITTELRAKFDETESDGLGITVNSYYGPYDGNAHGITVTSNHSDAQIRYGYSDGVCYLTESPTYTQPGTYVISYSVSKPGYDTFTGIVLMQIYAQDAWMLDVSASGWSGICDGLEHGITVSCGQEDATILYGMSADNITLTQSPVFIAAGEYVVYYRVVKDGYVPVTGAETVEISVNTNPGLYDSNGILVAEWDTLVSDYGMDITSNYTATTYATDENSLYYILHVSGEYPELAKGAVLILDSEVTSIGAYALYGCSDLVSVVIPDSVTGIGAYAFGGCDFLQSVTFEGVDTWIANSTALSADDPYRNASNLTADYVQYEWVRSDN